MHPEYGGQAAFDKVIPCPASGCLLDSIRGKQVFLQTFENFNPLPGTEKAFKAARALAYGEAKFIWLLIYGRPGCGKTHISNAIITVVRGRGLDVKMILAADLFSMLRTAMETHQTDNLLRRFKDIFFLAIDDYGVEYGSDWESAKFDELMTSRYATGKPTVLITNKELSDLPPRIQSRFQEAAIARAVLNSAPDYRVANRKGR